MAINPRRRQKQLARKTAKQKARAAKKKRLADLHSSPSFQVSIAAQQPIHECLMHSEIFESGIGHVIVSRRAVPQVAVGMFLVDVYCLGVKDAAVGFRSLDEYDALIERLQENEELAKVEPACARKLVESAVAYARGLGFSPHRDYFKVVPLFGDIDPGNCSRDFEFGKDGKPFYITGPYESEGRINLILRKLHEACGPEGYHFMAGGPGFENDEDPDWMDEEDVFADEDLEAEFPEEDEDD